MSVFPARLLLVVLLLLVCGCELALVIAHRRLNLARRGVEVAHPVARDLVAGWGHEGEAELVGALELHLEAREHEVGGERRAAVGDGGGFLRMRGVLKRLWHDRNKQQHTPPNPRESGCCR